MAKDNLFLGMARGSVGSVTFSRVDGQQVARARNRSPRNPQSPAQMVQRIIMSSVGKAYSFMNQICNHSFENFETGQMSQRKFMEVNVALMRDKVADVLAYPVESSVKASTAYNFSFKNDYAPVLNEYQISAGSLPSLALAETNSGAASSIACDPGEATTATATYADIVAMLGLQQGDQLTIVQVSHDGSKTGHEADILTGFRFARIILEPASGDMTTLFFDNQKVNDPNPRNEGVIDNIYLINTGAATGIAFRLGSIAPPDDQIHPDRQLAGSAVIVSRLVGNKWLRSTQFIKLRYSSGSSVLKSSELGLAYETYLLGAASDLYLNQAE